MVYAGPQPAWQAFERKGEGKQDSGLVNFYNIFKNKSIMYVSRGAWGFAVMRFCSIFGAVLRKFVF